MIYLIAAMLAVSTACVVADNRLRKLARTASYSEERVLRSQIDRLGFWSAASFAGALIVALIWLAADSNIITAATSCPAGTVRAPLVVNGAAGFQCLVVQQ